MTRIGESTARLLMANLGGIAGLCLMFATDAHSQEQLQVHEVSEGRLYWAEGGGGNSGIIIGDAGVIVVDAKRSIDYGRQLVHEIGRLTSKPITHIIQTHSDGDHTNGVTGFPDNALIIAHANNKAEQLAILRHAFSEVGGGRCLPPEERLPDKLIMSDEVAATINGINLVFYHFGPAHTTGDLVVYLPDDKFAFVGDLITNLVVVKIIKTGSLDGWFYSANKLLGLDVTSYLGGHATALDTKDSLRERVERYDAFRHQVSVLMDRGLTLPQIKAAMNDPPEAHVGCRGIPQETLTEVAYFDRIAKDSEFK